MSELGMVKDRVCQTILRIIPESIRPPEVCPENVLREELGMDSLAMLELIVELEDEFSLMIDDEFLFGTAQETVADLIDYVYTALAKRRNVVE